MTDKDLAAQYALAQYLRTATLAREAMLAALAASPKLLPARELFCGRDGSDLRPEFAHMRLWFAFLYVVLEGWGQLQLADPAVDECIDALRSTGELEALRRFRNAVFHLQADPLTPKFSDVLAIGINSGMPGRLVALHEACQAYFDSWRARADLSALSRVSANALFGTA